MCIRDSTHTRTHAPTHPPIHLQKQQPPQHRFSTFVMCDDRHRMLQFEHIWTEEFIHHSMKLVSAHSMSPFLACGSRRLSWWWRECRAGGGGGGGGETHPDWTVTSCYCMFHNLHRKTWMWAIGDLENFRKKWQIVPLDGAEVANKHISAIICTLDVTYVLEDKE